jgi:transcriptional regulator with GAF, ATPase, and Fis domain
MSTTTLPRAARRVRRRVRVTVVGGVDEGLAFEGEDRVRIGSRPYADLVLTDPAVSGVHCEITTGEDVRVRDLGSKNGTFIGSVRVVEAMLSPGEVLTVGTSRVQVLPIEGLMELPDEGEAQMLHGLCGRSAVMRRLLARIESVAAGDSTVLVQGETGSGKELVAEALHLSSRRAQGPLVTVDCGALPATLIDAELFGHERGAFTGAEQRFAGAFERAQGGTVFLDEIGELPLSLQPKLLRVIESRSVRRLGAVKTIPIDVRVVAATHRDLAMEVSAGRFREDLYYRLAVVSLQVPPLRERIVDLPLLVVKLLEGLGVDPAPFLTVESLQALAEHKWPGNVRELRNTLERAASLAAPPQPDMAATVAANNTIELDFDVPLNLGRKQLTMLYERRYLTHMLERCNGNIAEVARRSGLERMSVYRILRRLRIKE